MSIYQPNYKNVYQLYVYKLFKFSTEIDKRLIFSCEWEVLRSWGTAKRVYTDCFYVILGRCNGKIYRYSTKKSICKWNIPVNFPTPKIVNTKNNKTKIGWKKQLLHMQKVQLHLHLPCMQTAVKPGFTKLTLKSGFTLYKIGKKRNKKPAFSAFYPFKPY